MNSHLQSLVKQRFASMLVALSFIFAAPAFSAPLDALLDARPARHYHYGFLEVAGDLVNDTVDVLGFRDSKDAANGAGDYSGTHLRLGWQLTDKLWVEGSTWQRQITYGPDKPDIRSHSLAVQYRLLDQPEIASPRPDLALRLGQWGSKSGSVRKSTNTLIPLPPPLPALTANSVEVRDATDKQTQLDVILSWMLRRDLTVSLTGGFGSGNVEIGRLLVTQGANTGANPGGCSPLTVLLPPPATSADVDLNGLLCYKHTYQQLGANVQWQVRDDVTLKAGYLFQSMNRDGIDDALRQAGIKPTTNGHTIVAEAAYRFARFGQVFARGQMMSGPFVAEIPMLFNRFTASRYDEKYGFLTLGLTLDF